MRSPCGPPKFDQQDWSQFDFSRWHLDGVTLDAASAAFANLSRTGCGQRWCARLVEGNDAWGMRVDRMLPPLVRSARHRVGTA